MGNLFLSHSNKDRPVAQKIIGQLRERGFVSLFLDFDPEKGIPAGRHWERELYRQLRLCSAVIVLCSEDSMQSRWCFAEIVQARALGKRVIPFHISDCKIEGILMDVQAIDGRTLSDEAYERLCRALQDAAFEAKDDFEWNPNRSPYPGMNSFEEADAAIYFGRAQATSELVETIEKMRRFGDPRLLVVVGASGSGKSSLVRAGLIPRLKKDSGRWAVLPPFRPNAVPFEQLRRSLVTFCHENGIEPELVPLQVASGAHLASIAGQLTLAARRTEATLVIVVDQLEELFAGVEQCDEFIAVLLEAASAPGSPIIVLATLRSDFLANLQNRPPMRAVRFVNMPLGPMSMENFVQVIENPARRAAIELEPGLSERMVRDTEMDDALPLLAFVLREMYEQCRRDNRLTHAAYEQLNGIQGAVARVAEEIATRLGSSDEEAAVRASFLKMVRVNEKGQFVRQRVTWQEMPVETHSILEKFVKARLLVSQIEPRAARTLEVAHEALFRTWGRLTQWLNQDLEFLHWRQRMRAALELWVTNQFADSALLYGLNLTAADRWLDARGSDLDELEKSFISKSIAQHEATQAERERLLAEAQRHQIIAETQALGARALREFEAGRALEGLLTAVLAGRKLRTIDGEAPASFAYSAANPLLALQIILDNIFERNRLEHATEGPKHDAPKSAVQNRRTKTKTKTRKPPAKPLPSDQELVQTMGHEGRILAKTYSPDGRFLITSATDGTVRLLDQRVHRPAKLIGLQGAATQLALSDDGERFTTVDVWGTRVDWELTRWHLAQHTALLTGHKGGTRVARYSATGTHLATGGADGKVGIWSDAGEVVCKARKICAGAVADICFLPDEHSIRVVDTQGATKVWDYEEDLLTASINLRSGIDFSFSANGSMVAVAYPGGSAAIWDFGTGEQVQLSVGHRGWIMGIDLARNGSRVVTAGADDTVRVCDLKGKKFGPVISAEQGRVMSVSLSPDNALIASAGDDGTVKVWRGQEQVARCVGHRGKVVRVLFNGDGSLIASGGVDGTVRIWFPSGEQFAQFEGSSGTLSTEALGGDFGSPVFSFSPDGTKIAIPGIGEPVRVSRLQPLGELLRNADMWLEPYVKAHRQLPVTLAKGE